MKLVTSIFKKLDRNLVIRHIEEEVHFSVQYFVMLLLSVVIATLGLIINNNAIIIGAMLISPLIWPIIGISLATVRSKKNLMKKSVGLLFISLILIIATAYLISFMSPFKEVSIEMLSRVNPTIYDLIIALAAGLAATLILTWPKFSDSLAGVAIAASLVPPICVTGVGLAFNNMDMAYGSFLLFMTNLSSIIFAGIIVFSLAQFYRRDDEQYVKRMSIGLVASILVLGIISFQLILSLKQIIYEDVTERTIRQVMQQELSNISGLIQIDSVSIGATSDGIVNILSDIKSPANILITVSQKNTIIDRLATELEKGINLKMNITQVLEAVTYDEKLLEKQKVENVIDSIVTNYAKTISSQIEIQSVNSNLNEEEEKVFVNTVWQVPDFIDISIANKKSLEEKLILALGSEIDLKISIMRYFTLKDNVEGKDIDGIENAKVLLMEHTKDYILSRQSKDGVRFDYVEVDYNKKSFDYTIRLGVLIEQGDFISGKYVRNLRESLKAVFSPVDALKVEVQSRTYKTKQF